MSEASDTKNSAHSTELELEEFILSGHNSSNAPIRGALLQLNRSTALIEIYGPQAPLSVSEALNDFTLSFHNRCVYQGRATVRALHDTGATTLCEITLSENAWLDLEINPNGTDRQPLVADCGAFLKQWQSYYRINPDFKIVAQDLATFLSELRDWTQRLELRIFKSPPRQRTSEDSLVAALLPQVMPLLTQIFLRFEEVCDRLDESLRPTHRVFIQKQLHQFLLCSPFMFRTYGKPLGYAGDYEMMSMIVRNRPNGKNLFAKLIDAYLLAQHPCQAVRNRVDFLQNRIEEEVCRRTRENQPADIFCVACGPAWEAINFVAAHPLADNARFHLLDFNEETLDYTGNKFREVKRLHHRRTQVEYVRNSVHNLLRTNNRNAPPEPKYDLVYCSGLYDYLGNRVCQSLNNYLYKLLRPGGLMVIGNFAPFTHGQNLMEYLMDWHLIYRDRDQVSALAPEQASPEFAQVKAEHAGANIFLEVRKPAAA